MVAASVSAFFHQSENAAASAKNWSTLPCEMPGLPLRSASLPRHAMMSVMTAFVASSGADSAGTMPSPLNCVWAKIFAVSPASSNEIAVASFLPRFVRICLADARSCLPSGVESLMELSSIELALRSRSSGFFTIAQAHLTAAMISGARMRPSLSVSIRSSVFVSNSTPRVGQLNAAHSF